MSPVKSQGRTSDRKQRAAKKEIKQKNGCRNGSRASPARSNMSNGKQKRSGNSPTLEKGQKDEVNSKGRNKKDERKKRSVEQKEPQKEKGKKLINGRTTSGRLQPQSENVSESKLDINKASKLQPAPKTPTTKTGRINNKPSAKTGNRRSGRVTETEEEEEEDEEEEKSESDAGSSEEDREEEDDKDDTEEELRSNEEPVETQGSEESSEEEAEASDTQKDTEKAAADEASDKDLSEDTKTRSDPEKESVTTSEEEEESQREVEESEAITSDGGGDELITQEDTSEKPATDKASRRHRQTPRPLEPARVQKHKMFKKTKADKQAEKAEKQRAKAEKQRAEKEAKQKAKEDKKNKKKPPKEEKPSPAQESQPLKGISLNKIDTAKGKTQLLQLASKTKNIKEKIVLAETDLDEEEEEEAGPTLSSAIKGQNRLMLLKAKGKDLKASLDPEPAKEVQQQAGSDVKDRPSVLFRKVKMASVRHRTNKMLAKPDEELSENDAVDGGSSKPKECLIARRKGVTTLRRVSGWIQKKMPRGITVKKKVSAWSKVIEVSRWLSHRALKAKEGTRKSKGNFLKNRMAMRVATKTSMASKKSRNSSEEKRAKEKAGPQGKVGEGGEEGATAGEKEAEAKYAVVLPRMNKLGLAKTAQVPQAGSAASTPATNTGSSGGTATSEPKPPKPGARLVLPVKPDLSLLKSINKHSPGELTTGGDTADRNAGSSVGPAAPEGTSDTEDRNRKAALDSQDGVSVLQAAKGKLGSSPVNLTKISLSGGVIGAGPARARALDPEREAASGIPRSTTEPLQTGEAGRVVPGVASLYEEEVDREVAQLMDDGGPYTVSPSEVHWVGNTRMSGDPQVCIKIWH